MYSISTVGYIEFDNAAHIQASSLVGISDSNRHAFCLPMDTGMFVGSDKSFEKAKNFAMSKNLGRMPEIPDKSALASK
jgi:hypothetical protein